MQQRCKSCNWFRDVEEDAVGDITGHCILNPPVSTYMELARFPRVLEDMICAQWEANPEYKKHLDRIDERYRYR